MSGRRWVTGSAKAVTPFGNLTGRTTVTVEGLGEDLAVIDFRCGETPVSLALSGGNLHDLIRLLIAQTARMTAARMTAEHDRALEEGVA